MREADDELDRGLPLIDPNEDDMLEEKEGAEVELRDVWFSYPTRPGTILKGLDIKVERAQMYSGQQWWRSSRRACNVQFELGSWRKDSKSVATGSSKGTEGRI